MCGSERIFFDPGLARHNDVVSLTGHLADEDSPVRAYFANRFPHTRELKFADSGEPPTEVNLPSGPVQLHDLKLLNAPPPRVLPLDEAGYTWAVAGIAFDYRLRYEFEVGDPNTFTAAMGWTDLVRLPMGKRAADTGWSDLVQALFDLTSRANPVAGNLARSDELDLARLCGLLALYEQLYRMGGIFNQRTFETPIAQIGLNAPLERMLALVDDRLPADIAAMVALFRSSVPEVANPRNVSLNPRFARSADLLGADGDLIVDHLLLEVKTVKAAAISRRFAWQVLGYLLADTDDRHGIESVGWYFARQGTLWGYPVAEFLRRLAGDDVGLATARAEFADVCAKLRPRENSALRQDQRVEPESEELSTAELETQPSPVLIRHVQREVSFYPPAKGTGRWHAPNSEVPWVQSLDTSASSLDAPSCGASASLSLNSVPMIPPVGVEQQAVDGRLCRRCVPYTERFYASPFDPDSKPTLADLRYYPPRTGQGKWHVRAGATGFRYWGSPDAPACDSHVVLDLTVKPLRIPASGDIDDADERLCRRCLGTPERLFANVLDSGHP